MNRVILIVALIIVILSGIYFLLSSGKIPNPFQKGSTLGGQIFKKVQNPIQGKLPEVDAFQVETNPFKDIYPNPFRERK